MSHPGLLRPTWVEVDLEAVRNNSRVLSDLVSPSQLCAVVKADGYGHGAVAVARAAVAGGATWLAVALVGEGAVLRDAGIGEPILVLSEPSSDAMEEVVRRNLIPTVYSSAGIVALSNAVKKQGADPHPVHVKVDTGMHRVGCDESELPELVSNIDRTSAVTLQGVFTHYAVADSPMHPSNSVQQKRFESVLSRLLHRPKLVHSANSAATISFPAERHDLVRTGIALYGVAPSSDVALPSGIRPVLSLKSRVSWVRRLSAGERISYGHHYELKSDSFVATVPVGYADGIPRLASNRDAQVIINDRKYPIAGAVTMDQLMVDCGNDPVSIGDEVVLIGSQQTASITVENFASISGTVGYEIVTRIGPRVPRRYV